MNNFDTWLDAYKHLRSIMCKRCKDDGVICTTTKKIVCIEWFLMIIEDYEIGNLK